MANQGISNTHMNGSVSGNRFRSIPQLGWRGRIRWLAHAALFAASFLFVVALICGVFG